MAKIVSISQDESQTILQAQRQNRTAQKSLYETYAPKMLSICRYYIHDLHYAEDVMVKAFFKAFVKISNFDHKSSFDTWLKAITTNECIDFLRSKSHKLQFAEWNENLEPITDEVQEDYALQDLQTLIDSLPEGCKIVFNLYVLEEMKHSEIAEKLNISIGTSKSQLSYARKYLQHKINDKKHSHV